MATRWFCGHCHYGPMIMATTEHCVMCLRQRDNYATYANDQSSIASTAPPNRLDQSYDRTKCTDRGPTACQHKLESEDLASASLPWFCCQCKKSNLIAVFYGADDQNTGGDGPKCIDTEVKCLACDHALCAACDKVWQGCNATWKCKLAFSKTLPSDWPMKISYPCCDDPISFSRSAFFAHMNSFSHGFFFVQHSAKEFLDFI